MPDRLSPSELRSELHDSAKRLERLRKEQADFAALESQAVALMKANGVDYIRTGLSYEPRYFALVDGSRLQEIAIHDLADLEWPETATDEEDAFAINERVRSNQLPTSRLVIDPSVSTSSPVIKGTRLRAESIVCRIVDGFTWSDILAAHPEITADDIRACLAWKIVEDTACDCTASSEAPPV